MGRILTNYPPAMPLTAKRKREMEGAKLLNKATKSIWLSISAYRVVNALIGVYVRLVYAKRALKAIRYPHLGDIVYCQGKEWQLLQGACAPYWDLWHHGSRTRIDSIHESKFKRQPLYRRFWFSFRFTYRFYMTSWYRIDVMNKGRFIFK